MELIDARALLVGAKGKFLNNAEMLEALDMGIRALDAKIPKHPIIEKWEPARCPSCQTELSEHMGDGYTLKPLHELTALNKDRTNMVEVRQSDICLDDVIASPETIASIREIITEYKNRDKLDHYGLEVLNKILLSGPPGVGKTWTAMAIAGELNLDLVFVRWDSLISSYLGTTGANVRKVFEVANERPVVLFLDEFDSVGKERGGKDQEVGEMSRVVINLLQNIDMFPPESFLVTATNHAHLLDIAIWRRFTTIGMRLPDPEERQRLIHYYKKDLPVDIHIANWVKETEGLSGAEIKTLIHKEAKKQILYPKGAKLQLV